MSKRKLKFDEIVHLSNQIDELETLCKVLKKNQWEEEFESSSLLSFSENLQKSIEDCRDLLEIPNKTKLSSDSEIISDLKSKLYEISIENEDMKVGEFKELPKVKELINKIENLESDKK